VGSGGLWRTARFPSLLRNDQRERAERAEPTERTDPAEKADSVEPTEPTDSAEPTDPMLRTDPADPMDKTDPRLAIDRNESSDHNERVFFTARVWHDPRGVPRLGVWQSSGWTT
jgi:hypothetical protein